MMFLAQIELLECVGYCAAAFAAGILLGPWIQRRIGMLK